MRLAGGAYFDKQTGQPTGAIAQILSAPGHRYTLADLVACLPEPEPEQKPPASPPRLRPAGGGGFAPRPFDEIAAAAAFIPERLVGENTYEPCRRALCGCAAALAEAGHSAPDSAALDLLAAKWPSRAVAQQALQSSTTRDARAFWAIASEHGYSLRRGGQQQHQERAQQIAWIIQHFKHDGATDEQIAQMLAHLPAPEQEPGAQATEVKLDRLADRATQLLADRTPFASRLPILLADADAMSLRLRDGELTALLTAARRQRTHGGDEGLLGTGDALELSTAPWAWEGLILRGCLNLLVALPKLGKTSLMLAMIAAWWRNEPALLDRVLWGP